jgi:hypothetical protein
LKYSGHYKSLAYKLNFLVIVELLHESVCAIATRV